MGPVIARMSSMVVEESRISLGGRSRPLKTIQRDQSRHTRCHHRNRQTHVATLDPDGEALLRINFSGEVA